MKTLEQLGISHAPWKVSDSRKKDMRSTVMESPRIMTAR